MSGREDLLRQYRHAKQHQKKQELFDSGLQLVSEYLGHSDSDSARLLLKELQSTDNTYENLYLYEGVFYLQQNRYKEARESLRTELTHHPRNKRAKVLLNKLTIHQQLPFLTLSLFVAMCITFIMFQSSQLMTLITFAAHHQTFSLFSTFTSLFLHANLAHLIMNLALLLIFGFFLEKHIGSLPLLLIFIGAGIIGNGIQALVSQGSFVIGASAGIFGILGASMMREPMLDLRLFGIFKVPMILVFGAFFAIENLFRTLITSESFLLGSIAHLFGFLIGILVAGILYWETMSVFYNWLIIAVSFWFLFTGFDMIVTSQGPLSVSLFGGISLSAIATGLIVWSYTELTHQQEYVNL